MLWSRHCGHEASPAALPITAIEVVSTCRFDIPSGLVKRASVGSVGDSYDNALAETINGLFKAEVIHRTGPWKGLDEVERATLTWVDWFNHRRILEPIGDMPPVEYENLYYQQAESAQAA